MIKRYKCEMPFCNYQTNHRHKIHNHHIIPREAGGCNKSYNKIYLCPNCHASIFSIYAKRGIHSKKENNIEIIKWSNNRTVLEYIENGQHKIHFII
jgi:hypothetical protein